MSRDGRDVQRVVVLFAVVVVVLSLPAATSLDVNEYEEYYTYRYRPLRAGVQIETALHIPGSEGDYVYPIYLCSLGIPVRVYYYEGNHLASSYGYLTARHCLVEGNQILANKVHQNYTNIIDPSYTLVGGLEFWGENTDSALVNIYDDNLVTSAVQWGSGEVELTGYTDTVSSLNSIISVVNNEILDATPYKAGRTTGLGACNRFAPLKEYIEAHNENADDERKINFTDSINSYIVKIENESLGWVAGLEDCFVWRGDSGGIVLVFVDYDSSFPLPPLHNTTSNISYNEDYIALGVIAALLLLDLDGDDAMEKIVTLFAPLPLIIDDMKYKYPEIADIEIVTNG